MTPTADITPGPDRFFNRELSWLAFNQRVLEEALDSSNPLLERVKFATIVASNLDEFFMVRVAALKHAVLEGDTRPDPSGMSPAKQLEAISVRAHQMLDALYELVMRSLLPSLSVHGIQLLAVATLDSTERAGMAAHFRQEILPALTPLAIDFERPFPMISSLSVNVAFWLAPDEGETWRRLALVQVPARLARLVRVAGATPSFVLLDDLIRAEGAALFPGQTIVESVAFRLTRDSELEVDDEGGESYVEVIERELRKRRRGAPVRLELEASASHELSDKIANLVGVEPADVYRLPGPLDVRALMTLVELPGYAELRDTPRPPASVLSEEEQEEIFSVLDQRDVLLHHPYDSFDPVVALVDAAAENPDVLAIKQTLYRTSGDSPIVAALTRAADQGKQVTVIVELKARFDEYRNIQWARRLEEMGAHVIYGVRHYKVHAKICLVVKRTKSGLRRYMHLGTGNYNDRTARLYTDFGLMTSDADFGADASALFSALTGYSDPPQLRKLVTAPTMLRQRLLGLIERERRWAEAGQAAEIRAKMNSLVDTEIIQALYAASQAGVHVRLNVRGICMLRPGVKGLSESITVVSVVGRYLEHSRVFVFNNGGNKEVYLSSADWMTRNLDKRIELMFPIESKACRRKVLESLDAMFRDNVKGRRLSATGDYRVPEVGEWRTTARLVGDEHFEAQVVLHEQAERRSSEDISVLFEPLVDGPGKRSRPA
jgi:polyphosphate kinase